MLTVHELEPTDIRVREGLDRYRTDMGDIKELAASIIKYGQLQPIVITKNKELIAGGRRLAACIFASRNVQAVYRDDITDDMLRILEIEENVRRKQFTPAEEELAIAELHRLKQKETGETVKRGPKSKADRAKQWTLDDTAALLGKSRGFVINSLQNAEAILKNPELKTAKTKREISAKAKRLDAVADAVDRAQQNQARMAEKKTTFTLSCSNATDFLAQFSDLDLIVTDPPYMIDIHEQRHTMTKDEAYDDCEDSENNAWIYNELPAALYAATKETGHCFMFLAREARMYYEMYQRMTAAGWDVLAWPIIWVKGVTGQCNNPATRPGNCWEAIMYARKPRARFVREAMPDWVQCDPINAQKQVRQAEKPVALIENLIVRASMPGHRFADPCMGTGSSIEAAHKNKLEAFGNDKDPEAHALAMERMAKYVK